MNGYVDIHPSVSTHYHGRKRYYINISSIGNHIELTSRRYYSHGKAMRLARRLAEDFDLLLRDYKE